MNKGITGLEQHEGDDRIFIFGWTILLGFSYLVIIYIYIYINIHTYTYSALRKYSHPFILLTFCYVAASC